MNLHNNEAGLRVSTFRGKFKFEDLVLVFFFWTWEGNVSCNIFAVQYFCEEIQVHFDGLHNLSLMTICR